MEAYEHFTPNYKEDKRPSMRVHLFSLVTAAVATAFAVLAPRCDFSSASPTPRPEYQQSVHPRPYDPSLSQFSNAEPVRRPNSFGYVIYSKRDTPESHEWESLQVLDNLATTKHLEYHPKETMLRDLSWISRNDPSERVRDRAQELYLDYVESGSFSEE